MRVGVAFARGLSLALDIPSVGITSLEALEGMPQDKRVLGLLPAKCRPPERTWWAQVLEKGKGVAESVELDSEHIRALAESVDAICGGIESVPEFGKLHMRASPTAKAAATLAGRFEGDLPAARPVYVRDPDATPMGAGREFRYPTGCRR